MAKPGPRRQPTELKKLHGTFRPDRDSVGPVPKGDAPDCPYWLPDEAREKWGEIAPRLTRLKLLTELDGDELARYCLYSARAIDAEGLVEQHGLLIPGAVKGTMVKNPAVQIARDYNQMASKIADKFGMNPSNRNGLNIEWDDDEDDDPINILMNRRREGSKTKEWLNMKR